MEKLLLWRVKVGKLYYVQGLLRYVVEGPQKYKNLEFTTYKDAAFIFLFKETAERLADEIDGIVEEVELTTNEYSILIEKHEYHINSESDWNKYAMMGMYEARDDLK